MSIDTCINLDLIARNYDKKNIFHEESCNIHAPVRWENDIVVDVCNYILAVGYKMHFFQITLATAFLDVLWCQGKGQKKILEKFSNFKVCPPKNRKKRADAPKISIKFLLHIFQSQHTCVIHLFILCFLGCRIQKTCYFTVLITSSS